MNKVNYFFTFLFFFSSTLIVNAQERQHFDWEMVDKLPVTSDELVKYHLEKMQIDFLDGKNVQMQHTSKLLLNYYAIDTYLMQVWNGTTWKDSVRGDYTYNPQGWLTELLYEIWSSAWINYSHFIYTYTGYGYVATEIAQDWNGASWVNNQRITNSYNSNNKKTQTVYESWNGTTWVNSSQYFYEYYPDGNMEKQIYQIWTGAAWQNYSQEFYEYDNNDLTTQVLGQLWSGSTWVNYYKYNASYNNNGDYLTLVFYIWSGGWQNSQQVLFTYNGSGWLTIRTQQSWNSSIGWVNFQQDSYTYDGVGNQTVELIQLWSASQWYNYSNRTNVYNGGGDCIEYTIEKWNSGSGWVNESHFTGEYDSNGNLLTKEYQVWDGTEWVYTSRYAYTYLYFVSDVEKDGLVKEYSLDNNYPNPFNPTTTIKFSIPSSEFTTLKVYDIIGNEISTLVNEEKTNGRYEITFDATLLPSGVYFYQLKAGSFVETKKMVLMK